MAGNNAKIRAEVIKQIEAGASVAPRDVAQALVTEGEDWRKLLPAIKQEAHILHSEGLLVFIRKKKVVSPDTLKGVYRLARSAQVGSV